MLIQTIDPGRALQRRYRLQNLPSTVLAQEVVPVCIVDDLASADDFDKPEDRGAYGSHAQVGAAGEVPWIAIVALPNTAVVLERALVYTDVDSQISVRRASAGLTGLGAASTQTGWADARTHGRPTAVLQGASGVAVPGGTRLIRIPTVALEPVSIDLRFLIPGFTQGQTGGTSSLFFDSTTVASTIIVSLYWREQNRGG